MRTYEHCQWSHFIHAYFFCLDLHEEEIAKKLMPTIQWNSSKSNVKHAIVVVCFPPNSINNKLNSLINLSNKTEKERRRKREGESERDRKKSDFAYKCYACCVYSPLLDLKSICMWKIIIIYNHIYTIILLWSLKWNVVNQMSLYKLHLKTRFIKSKAKSKAEQNKMRNKIERWIWGKR